MKLDDTIMDIHISEEQTKIINTNGNLKINSVAGSGKTTTILLFAKNNPDKSIIQITFNDMLKKDVRKMVKVLNLHNIEIHTYHSLAVKYYSPLAFNDETIKSILIHKSYPIVTLGKKIDCIIIDEAQDMNITYMKLVKKFITDTENENTNIWVIGDKLQSIYGYKGAHHMFLTNAEYVWKQPFTELCLTTSFRSTIPIVKFINRAMYGLPETQNMINSSKVGEPVDYYIGNSFEAFKKIGSLLIKKIKQGTLLPDDIFVVSPSIKSANAPFIKLENYLVLHGIPCFVPTNDDSVLTDGVIEGKVTFTSIHQTKGRERKYVIAFGFDDSYFKYYLKNADASVCPNILYVLVTRASEKLILFHDEKFRPLPFLKLNDPNFAEYVNFIDLRTTIKNISSHDDNQYISSQKHTTVTDLVKFISDDVSGKIIPLIENIFIKLQSADDTNDIPIKITVSHKDGKVTQEDVSEINGITIPSMYEKQTSNEVASLTPNGEQSIATTNSFMEEFLTQFVKGITDVNLKEYAKKLVLPCMTIRDYLFASNFYVCATMGLYSKLAQIKSYNWLKKTHVNQCFKNMEILRGKKIKYEIEISNSENPHKNVIVSGRMDAMCPSNVYEFKCTTNLCFEHKLQIIVYEWLYRVAEFKEIYGKKSFILLNIRTGEMLQLSRIGENRMKIDKIVDLLITGKFVVREELNEEEFMEMIDGDEQ